MQAVHYRGFSIYTHAEPVSSQLLGPIEGWTGRGAIDYIRPNRSVVELVRFRVPGFTFEDQETAECFALELGRLVIATCYRDLAVAPYESEKRAIFEARLRRR